MVGLTIVKCDLCRSRRRPRWHSRLGPPPHVTSGQERHSLLIIVRPLRTEIEYPRRSSLRNAWWLKHRWRFALLSFLFVLSGPSMVHNYCEWNRCEHNASKILITCNHKSTAVFSPMENYRSRDVPIMNTSLSSNNAFNEYIGTYAPIVWHYSVVNVHLRAFVE